MFHATGAIISLVLSGELFFPFPRESVHRLEWGQAVSRDEIGEAGCRTVFGRIQNQRVAETAEVEIGLVSRGNRNRGGERFRSGLQLLPFLGWTRARGTHLAGVEWHGSFCLPRA